MDIYKLNSNRIINLDFFNEFQRDSVKIIENDSYKPFLIKYLMSFDNFNLISGMLT